MYEFVGQYESLGVADGGKDAGIGVVPAIEDQGGLCPEEPGEFVLQLGIAGEVAGEQAGRRGGGQAVSRRDDEEVGRKVSGVSVSRNASRKRRSAASPR